MKKAFLLLIYSCLILTRAHSVEGMWLPMLLSQLNETEMKAMGFRLTAEDIYSVNRTSLKDAILIFGRGCTASFISDEGLILTNHHCGYGNIQRLSSIENDYLTHGFWAMSRTQELPNPGLTVTLLIRMEDVTRQVIEGTASGISEAARDSIIRANIRRIEKLSADTSGYATQVRAFYYGNEYYLFFTETFNDIRLVGAPPSSIGNFGGDTDNWMWPRHTGDFSLFRVYANRDNKPAPYSPENVPYRPKYHFKISLKGIEEGDFTFVLGYPGSTRQYLPSIAVEHITSVLNPVAVKLRDFRLKQMKEAMGQDPAVRIQYASKYAGIANGWKKMIGESRGIRRIDAVQHKRNFEEAFQQWVLSTESSSALYGTILPEFRRIYEQYTPLLLARTYINEAPLSVELLRLALQAEDLVSTASAKSPNQTDYQERISKLKTTARDFYRNYHMPLDRKLMAGLFRFYYNEQNPSYQPTYFIRLISKHKGDFEKLSHTVFSQSIFADSTRFFNFLSHFKPGDARKIANDPAYKLGISFVTLLRNQINPEIRNFESRLDYLQRQYVAGMRVMQPDKRFYPDANFTLRVTYGKVEGYYPADAIYYRHYTTSNGILEKEDPEISDYKVSPELKKLFLQNEFGQYASKTGELRTCFIASNHTTGGNSGSPVLNADGHLVGINFDRNWEGTMSDLMYDPDQCRNITLDIRYCLFVIDKFAGASHLISEMSIIE